MKSFLRRKQAQAIAALVMAIAVLATLVGLVLSTAIAGAAPPNGRGAQKEPLTNVNRNCSGTEQSDGTGLITGGFAIINKTGSGQLIANVVITNGTPLTTYNVRLIATPRPTGFENSCLQGAPGVASGILTTDAQGQGTVNIHLEAPDAKDAFVSAIATLPGNFFTSPEATFS